MPIILVHSLMSTFITAGNNDILTVLDLSWNHLRHRGGIAIARGLKVGGRERAGGMSERERESHRNREREKERKK